MQLQTGSHASTLELIFYKAKSENFEALIMKEFADFP